MSNTQTNMVTIADKLEFPDFQQYEVEKLKPNMKKILLLGFVFVILFILKDLWNIANFQAFSFLLKLGILAALGCMLALVIHVPFNRHLSLGFLILGLAIFTIAAVLRSKVNPQLNYLLLNSTYFHLGLVVFSPIFSKKYIIAFMAVGLTLLLTLMYSTFDAPLYDINNISIRVVAMNIFVVVTALLVHSNAQRHYLLAQKVHSQSITDALTKCHNRYGFFMHVNQAWYNSIQYGSQLSLLLLDLDHFKKINDKFGHLNGDIVLKQFSTELKKLIHESDILARFGGEEFIVLMPDTDIISAKKTALAIQSFYERFAYQLEMSEKFNITVSIGVATRMKKHKKPEDLIKAADLALYKAKENGRNQVQVDQYEVNQMQSPAFA